MVNISGAQPHVLRITIAVACILTVFLFFDPIGFASNSVAQLSPGRTTTVTHVVLFQYKADTDTDSINEANLRFLALKESCVSPNSQHAYIRSITGGRDHSQENQQHGHTHGFVVQFESTDDRNYYVEQDPAHKSFKKLIEPIVEKVTVVDYTNGVF
ncbi:stress responsive A/B barrel domain-containing protein [Podospora fimiseda]|uniref:Stress responsive A/B barrel domain-containing protein n=1 Tax=Podospora fimiseda TaxID=252190 RepID=A0AAN7GU74_9PEZI|nr:stress responsive A/B barrel domain-containing protein [Podospora fimiseda]